MDTKPVNSAPLETVTITMLGELAIRSENGSLMNEASLGRSLKQQGVLAYLILHRERPVSQSELIEQFWPETESANPVSALKTTLFRVRALLDPLFADGVSPIQTQRGAYLWNPGVLCALDIDWFEELCRQAADTLLPAPSRVALYREAVILYHGDMLPSLKEQTWLSGPSTHYHMRYVEAVKSLSDLLEQCGCYEEMHHACAAACEIEPLDEGLHSRLIRALLHQGEQEAALRHYQTATELLYRDLRVRPSEELRTLYTQIMDTRQNTRHDLSLILDELRETEYRSGAFDCVYGFFKEFYRLEARRVARTGHHVHIGLISATLPNGKAPPPSRLLSDTMRHLQDVLIIGLRKGDVISQYSGAQYVVMLPDAGFDDCRCAIERVLKLYEEKYGRCFVDLDVCVRPIEPSGGAIG